MLARSLVSTWQNERGEARSQCGQPARAVSRYDWPFAVAPAHSTRSPGKASIGFVVSISPTIEQQSAPRTGQRAASKRIASWFDRFATERASWRSRNAYYYGEIERLAKQAIPPGARVLELGCGIGDLLASVQPLVGVGVDVSEAMIEVARRRHAAYGQSRAPAGQSAAQGMGQGGWPSGRLMFLRGDAEAPPVNTTFDYVILSDLLGHIDDIQSLLDRLHAVCTPQTKVLITYWNFAWQPALWLAERLGLKMPQGKQNWLGMADVDNLLRLADFQIVQRGTNLLLPKPVPLLAPLLNKLAIRLPGLDLMGLVTQWVVQPRTPRPAAEALSCTVIVPCRNEQGNIDACISRMPKLGAHTEIMFVDGDSTDGTREHILELIRREAAKPRHQRLDIKLLDQMPRPGSPPPPQIAPFAATTLGPDADGYLTGTNGTSVNGTASKGTPSGGLAGHDAGAGRIAGDGPAQGPSSAPSAGPVKMLRLGKGDAVRKGFAAASGDVLFILDSDLTVPPEDLPKFLTPLATEKAEFVNGTRLVYPLEDEAMRWYRLLGNKFFSVVFTWLLDQHIKDTLCGTKVLRKRDYDVLSANRSYFGDFDPFGDFDLLFGAARMGLRIVEVPVRYRRRTYGFSKVQVFEHGPLLLRMSLIGFRRLKLARWLGTAGSRPPRPGAAAG